MQLTGLARHGALLQTRGPAGSRRAALRMWLILFVLRLFVDPMENHYCAKMAEAVTSRCDEHSDRFDCPDALVHYSPFSGANGLIIHNGGTFVLSIALNSEITDSFLTRLGPRRFRRWHGAEFAVANSSAGMGDVHSGA